MLTSRLYLFLLCVLFLTACTQTNSDPLPTLASIAQLPDPTATGRSLPPTNLPPTREIANTATPLATREQPTRPPTATPTPVLALLNVSRPISGDDVTQGEVIEVQGIYQSPNDNLIIIVALVAENGSLLASAQANANELGWSVELLIPAQVSGPAYVQATLRDESTGETVAFNQTEVTIVPDFAENGRYLDIYNPKPNDTIGAGFLMFFDGVANRPSGGAVRMSLWVNGCQEEVNFYQLGLNGSGYWQGFMGVPNDVPTGTACAIVEAGDPETENWRAVIIPVVIAGEEELTNGEGGGLLRIGSPPNGATFPAGSEIFMYGTSSISEGEVSVEILLENGRVVSEFRIPTDYSGYWETNALLPFGIEGPAIITVYGGDPLDENSPSASVQINIDPAPTPTTPPLIAPTATATPEG